MIDRLSTLPTAVVGRLAERRDALARTDRGVFSSRMQEALLADDRIRHLRGRVAHAVARDGRIRLTLSTNRGSEALETVHGFDLVIDGSGADGLLSDRILGADFGPTAKSTIRRSDEHQSIR